MIYQPLPWEGSMNWERKLNWSINQFVVVEVFIYLKYNCDYIPECFMEEQGSY